jgi:phage shock protein E
MKTTISSFACLGLILTMVSCGPRYTQMGQDLSPEDFHRKIMDKAGILIDVRTPEEYAEGHLAGSINIDFKAADFRQRIDSLDKKGTYLLYCRSGNRSGKAMDEMKGEGFSGLYNLEGGIEAWKNSHLPITSK